MLPLTRSRNRSRFFGIPFSPSSLFAAGEQGAWYDPSDYSTLFTDSAGTTPVTAVEQFVGLMLDKSKGLVLGSELATGILGSTSGWTFVGAANVTGGAIVFNTPPSTNASAQYNPIVASGKWYQSTIAITGTGQVIVQLGSAGTTVTLVAPGTYTFRGLASGGTPTVLTFSSVLSSVNNFVGSVTAISVRELPGNHAFQTTSAKRPKLAARYNILLNSATLATQNVTTQATDYTLRFEGAGTVTLSGTATGTLSAGVNTFTATAGTLTLTVSGTVTSADLRPSSQATGLIGPLYQAITTATVYDTAGFLPYLAFDGLDDSMSTNSIDFSATDKMSAWAGVRKLSDAAATIIVEDLSTATNDGSFSFAASGTDGVNRESWAIAIRGTTNQAVRQPRTYIAPVTSVLSFSLNTGAATTAAQIVPRVNGATPSIITDVAGPTSPGNFSNRPIYIGARGGNSFYFIGWLTSLIIRGAQSTQSQIEATEAWVNSRTGAY